MKVSELMSTMNDSRVLKKRSVARRVKKYWLLYVLLLFPVGYTVLFSYVPMYGLQLAFKNFRAADGIWNSPWNNYKHFQILFQGLSFPRAFWNTLYISFMRLIFGFPAPIIFAILINEIRHLKFKKTVQSLSYLPNFMSWVVLGGLIKNILSPTRGAINAILAKFGVAPIFFMTIPSLFVPILLVTGIWAGVGWGAIIYLATMTGIDPELYESAEIDGARRFRKAWHITIPGIMPVIVIQLILSVGSILNGGFDQIFNLMNPLVMETAEIIDTYVYRIGLQEMRYDLATAVGLFKNVVGVILIVIVNFTISKFSEHGIW